MEPPKLSFKNMPCTGSLFRSTKKGRLYHGDMYGIIVLYQYISANTHNLVLRKSDVTCSELLFADVEHVLRFFVDVAKKKKPHRRQENASRIGLFNQDTVGMDSFLWALVYACTLSMEYHNCSLGRRHSLQYTQPTDSTPIYLRLVAVYYAIVGN